MNREGLIRELMKRTGYRNKHRADIVLELITRSLYEKKPYSLVSSKNSKSGRFVSPTAVSGRVYIVAKRAKRKNHSTKISVVRAGKSSVGSTRSH